MTPEQYKKISAPSEETEQIHLMQWCRWAEYKYPELAAIYHVPNEGKRSASTGGKLIKMGLRPGVPDICLPVPKGGYSGLYIELKRIGGKPTEEQIDWLELLNNYGHCVAICEGAEAAERVITAYCERNYDDLDKLRLSGDRGDFEKLRGPKRSTKRNLSASVIIAVAMLIMQLTASAVDLYMHGTVTGLSLLVPLVVAVVAAGEDLAKERRKT